MKNNFSLKFKIFDIFVLVFVTICLVATIITTNIVFAKGKDKASSIQIYYQNKMVEEILLEDVDDHLDFVLTKEKYDGLRGDMTISIDKEKGVCISEVNCPNHLCEKMGWVNEVGVPVVCLPNNVYVIIASTSIDQDITLM
jgi:hypothetical protein